MRETNNAVRRRPNTRRRRKNKPLLFLIIAAEVLVLVLLLAVIWKPIQNALLGNRADWEEKDGQRYYKLAKGGYAANWLDVEGKRYYFDPEKGCAMVTGWLVADGATYYLATDGAMQTGWQEVDGDRYYLGADGKMQTGWVTTADGTYYLSDTGILQTGWLDTDGKRYYLDVGGVMQTGWQEIDGSCYYLDADGIMLTGWQEIDGNRYYLDTDGVMYTGWLELDGSRYYLKTDGAAAKGKLVVDEKTYYFTSKGAEVLLVNRWNPVPKNYVPEELVACKYNTSFNCKMTPEAVAALDKMIEACKNAGFSPLVRTGYRSYSYQQMLLDNKMDKGYSYEEAIKSVAVPGTSEHQTGLAVDISDSSYTNLNRQQGSLPIQKWLKEHCHEYGFIVRYPDDTTHLTGIIYESWHYRYVGVELATELYELDICLEEYLDRLTDDGTTCGDPASLTQ